MFAFVGIIPLLFLCWIGLVIWAMVDTLRQPVGLTNQLLMILLIWFAPLVGVLLYFFWFKPRIQRGELL